VGGDHLILVGAALLTAGLVASLLATRVRVPALLLFLGLGMVIGSDGLGWIDFSDYELARTVGVISLALILFEGGLTSGVLEIRPVLGAAVSLATVGTAVTAAIAGIVASALFGLDTLDGLLIGAIVASTDGAAIFALLRGSSLKRRLARTLEGESGFNDPVAVLLVIALIEAIEHPDYGVGDAAELLARQIGIGLAVGLAVGWVAVRALQRARLDSTGLYPVASLAVAGLAFGGADALEGSGFLSVYLAGLALGSAQVPAKFTITAFHQGMAWVAQVAMFITLGLLVFPSELDSVAVEGTVLGLVMVFVARPAAVYAATAFSRFGNRERIVLSMAGLRGAVPVVLATFPVIAGVEGAEELFNIVFFAVVVSTILQGTMFEPIAERLGATTSEPAMPRPLAEAGTIRRLGAEVLEYPIAADDAIAGARVRDLSLPREAVVSVIVRGREAIPPRGSTRLRAGDRIHVLLRSEAATEMAGIMARWHTGPIGRPPRPRLGAGGRSPIYSTRPLAHADIAGDIARPDAVSGQDVVERLRIRRDVAGALVLLADGRYAVTGPLVMCGSRQAVMEHAARRMSGLPADADERAWLENVVGALAADVPGMRPA